MSLSPPHSPVSTSTPCQKTSTTTSAPDDLQLLLDFSQITSSTTPETKSPNKHLPLIIRLKQLKRKASPTSLLTESSQTCVSTEQTSVQEPPPHQSKIHSFKQQCENSQVDSAVSASLHGSQSQWNLDCPDKEDDTLPVWQPINPTQMEETERRRKDAENFLQQKVQHMLEELDEYTEHDEELAKWLRRKKYRLTPALQHSRRERTLARKEKKLQEQLEQIQKKRKLQTLSPPTTQEDDSVMDFP